MTIIILDIWSSSEFYPVAWDILLVRTANNTFCLTDGQRVGPAYDDAEQALLDRTVRGGHEGPDLSSQERLW